MRTEDESKQGKTGGGRCAEIMLSESVSYLIPRVKETAKLVNPCVVAHFIRLAGKEGVGV